MKNKFYFTCAFILLFVVGCNSMKNSWKHNVSDTFGINRKVSLYGGNGEVIKSWEIDSKVEDRGGTCQFIDKNFKVVTISGTFIIEEQ